MLEFWRAKLAEPSASITTRKAHNHTFVSRHGVVITLMLALLSSGITLRFEARHFRHRGAIEMRFTDLASARLQLVGAVLGAAFSLSVCFYAIPARAMEPQNVGTNRESSEQQFDTLKAEVMRLVPADSTRVQVSAISIPVRGDKLLLEPVIIFERGGKVFSPVKFEHAGIVKILETIIENEQKSGRRVSYVHLLIKNGHVSQAFEYGGGLDEGDILPEDQGQNEPPEEVASKAGESDPQTYQARNDEAASQPPNQTPSTNATVQGADVEDEGSEGSFAQVVLADAESGGYARDGDLGSIPIMIAKNATKPSVEQRLALEADDLNKLKEELVRIVPADAVRTLLTAELLPNYTGHARPSAFLDFSVVYERNDNFFVYQKLSETDLKTSLGRILVRYDRAGDVPIYLHVFIENGVMTHEIEHNPKIDRKGPRNQVQWRAEKRYFAGPIWVQGEDPYGNSSDTDATWENSQEADCQQCPMLRAANPLNYKLFRAAHELIKVVYKEMPKMAGRRTLFVMQGTVQNAIHSSLLNSDLFIEESPSTVRRVTLDPEVMSQKGFPFLYETVAQSNDTVRDIRLWIDQNLIEIEVVRKADLPSAYLFYPRVRGQTQAELVQHRRQRVISYVERYFGQSLIIQHTLPDQWDTVKASRIDFLTGTRLPWPQDEPTPK
jgi:hypothetical protein